ncbi:hypothetical protein LINPERHAP1_LOCUS26617 [Linum perenne]
MDACIPTDQQIRFHGRKSKYYLMDSGYSNIPGFLAPYWGIASHFQEIQRRGGPRGRDELFYRHSSLWNVTERCFDVLKARFPILKFMRSYSFKKQTWIVIWPAAQFIISSGYMLQEMTCLINFKIVMQKMQQLKHS